MSNNNGLLASVDVCATGSPDSAYFVRVGEQIAIPSPLQIFSPNGLEVGTVAVDNSGNLALTGTVVEVDSSLTIAGSLSMSGTLTGASNVVYGQGSYLVDRSYTAPTTPASGFTEVVVATWTPPKAGLYLISGSYGIDAGASAGYTAVPPDNIGWTLRPSGPPPYPTDSIGAVTMFVYTVAVGENNDYGSQSTTLAKLSAIPYDIIAVVDNISGTMTGTAPLVTRVKVATIA